MERSPGSKPTRSKLVAYLPFAVAKLFFSWSSPWWCEAVKLLMKTEAEFVKGLVYM